jgi:hypothetical protein
MANDKQLNSGLDSDLALTHERFVAVMEDRLGEMSLDTKERYFAVLSLLVSKLEDPSKTLQSVLQEMVAEAATIIMAEMQR